MLVQLDMLQHRHVEKILQSRLEVAVEIGILQNARGFLAADIEVALEDDAILGQRAGLVGAQDVHRAEVLNGVEAFDDHLGACHRGRALRQVDRHDHRQHFRREPDRDRHGEQQRLQPVVLGQAVDEKDQRSHHQDAADHQPGEAVDAAVEGGGNALPRDLVGELPEERVFPGAHDDADRVAADDVGAHEADIRQLEGIVETILARMGELLGRHRLAGQGRLVDEQVLGLEQTQIGGHHVAGRQAHDVARNQRLDRNLVEIAGLSRHRSPHARGRPHHRAQTGGGVVGAVLLNERGRDRQQDHEGDHDRRPRVAQEAGHDRQSQQQRIERVADTPPKLLQDGRPVLARDEIEAVLREPPLRILLRKAGGGRGEPLARLRRRQEAEREQLIGLRRGPGTRKRALRRFGGCGIHRLHRILT